MFRKPMTARMAGWIAASLLTSGIAGAPVAWAARVTSVDFKGTKDPAVIEIVTDGAVTVDKQMNSADRQMILEISGATISKSASRAIDTSSFDSPVSMVSPYQAEGRKDTVRVVVQLRDNADPALDPQLTQQGNRIRVSIPRGAGGAASSTRASDSARTSMDLVPPPPPAMPAMDSAPAMTAGEPTAAKLDNFVSNKETQLFTGKPITLQIRDVDVQDVFRLIGEASGFNIILGDDVKGKLTLSLVDVPWDQALDVVLNTLHLGAERNNNILRVLTLENLTKEKMAQLQAKKSQQVVAPRVTRVFQINYANLTDLEKTIQGLLGVTAQGNNANAAAIGDTGKSVMSDARTNSLIVYETVENIERIRKLLEILDVQTPQVMIEGKVVEASESFSRNLSGSLGFGQENGGGVIKNGYASFNGANPVNGLFGTPGVFSDGGKAADTTKNAGGMGLSFLFGNGVRLNSILNMGEVEGSLKIVSAPKAVVLNKAAANIVQSTPVLIPTTTAVPGVGSTTSYTTVQANLSLDVKPTVANDGSVLMELTLTRDIPVALGDQSAVANRKITTTVLVESGSTLVLGGFYTMRSEDTDKGFPFLHKLPIIGWLFGSKTSSTDKGELFFFITPQVINPKKAGFSS